MVLFVIGLFYFGLIQSSALKAGTSQLSYQDQYENCQKEYRLLHNSMKDKLKYFTDNEEAMLNSVKETVLTLYSKSEKFTEFYSEEVTILNKKLESCNDEMASVRLETERKSRDNEAKIKDSIEQVKLKDSQITMLLSDKERLQHELDTEKGVSKKIEEELGSKVTVLEEKLEKLTNKNKIISDEVMKIQQLNKEELQKLSSGKENLEKEVLEYRSGLIKTQEALHSNLEKIRSKQQSESPLISSISKHIDEVREKGKEEEKINIEETLENKTKNRKIEAERSTQRDIHNTEKGFNIVNAVNTEKEKAVEHLNPRFIEKRMQGKRELNQHQALIPTEFDIENKASGDVGSFIERKNTQKVANEPNFIENTFAKFKRLFQPMRFKEIDSSFYEGPVSNEPASFKEINSGLTDKVTQLTDSNFKLSESLIVKQEEINTSIKQIQSEVTSIPSFANQNQNQSKRLSNSTELPDLQTMKDKISKLETSNISLKEALAEMELKNRVNQFKKNLN